MSVEQAIELVARMASDDQYARSVHVDPEVALADLDLTAAERDAVVADAATIVTVRDAETSGYANPSLRVSALPGFDVAAVGKSIVIIGDPDGRNAQGLISSDVGILHTKGDSR